MKAKSKLPLVIGLLLLCVIIAVVPLVAVSGTEFGGSDGKAEGLIEELAPGIEPWAAPIFELPGSETETLLFCLQAAIGGIVMGFVFGYFVARNKFSKEEKNVSVEIE